MKDIKVAFVEDIGDYSGSYDPISDSIQISQNARTADEPISLVREAPKTLRGGMLNRGGYVKLP